MKKGTIFLAIFLLFVCASFAQERYGNVRGVVVDKDEVPLPGVTVTLESEYAPRSVITTEAGIFRFINVGTGTYKLTCSLAGFKTYIQENIIVRASANIDLKIVMEVPSLAEEVTVIAKAPIVDSKKTSISVNIPIEALEELPQSRDPWDLVAMQPGTVGREENVGGSASGHQYGWGDAKGAPAGSDIYNMDGVVITAGSGNTPSYYNYASFEEVEVTTAGNDASVQGGTSVNFITRRGSNKFAIEGHLFYTGDPLQGDNRSQVMIERGYKGDTIRLLRDFGLQMGGPIIKDKLWFWAGWAMSDIKTRTILGEKNDVMLDIANAKLNMQLGPRDRAELSWNLDSKTASNQDAGPDRPPETTIRQEGPARNFKGEYEHTFSDNFLVSAKWSIFPSWWAEWPMAGWLAGKTKDVAIQVGYDEELDRYSDSYMWTRQVWDSYDLRADANLFLEKILGGDHEFKFGFEWRYLPHEYENGYSGDVLRFFRNGVPESAQVYRDRAGGYLNSRYSVYIQDSFTKGRLTLNLGLRYDREKAWVGKTEIGASTIAPDLLPGLSWKGADPGLIWQNISPRLGLTYDLFGDGKTILKLKAGRYGTTMRKDLARQISPVQLAYAEYYWNDLNGDRWVTLNELVGYPYVGMIGFSGFDPLNPTSLTSPNQIDSNLKSPILSDEIILGIEKELITDFAGSLNFFLRRNHNYFWYPYVGISQENYVGPITGSVDYAGQIYNYQYWTLNERRPSGTILTSQSDYYQNYYGIEFVANKRLSNKWMINASATFQDFTNHYGDKGYLDPTNLEFLEGGSIAPARWMAKLAWLYQLPYGFNFSGYANIREGKPFDPVINVRAPERAAVGLGSTINLNVDKLGSKRLQTFSRLDLRLSKDFMLRNYGKVSLAVEVFNLFNSNWELARYTRINSATYGFVSEILKPRIVRFSIRYSL